MHKKYVNFFLKSSLQFDSEFPLDSCGGLRLAVSGTFEGLESKT